MAARKNVDSEWPGRETLDFADLSRLRMIAKLESQKSSSSAKEIVKSVKSPRAKKIANILVAPKSAAAKEHPKLRSIANSMLRTMA